MTPNGFDMFHVSRDLSENVVYLLPRTVSTDQLRLLLKPDGTEECEVEYQYLNDRLKAACCYFGKVIKH